MSNTLHVMVLAEKWGSPKDGLATINRELVKYFAKSPMVEKVTAFVPPGQDSSVYKDAELSGAHLLEAEECPGMTGSQLLSFPPADLDIDVVVGYGLSLGPQAKQIKAFKNCKWIQFVHVSSEELGMHKGCREYEEKHREEIKLCEKADLVVAIGPKLADTFSAGLRYCNKDVEKLTPGLFEDLGKIQPAEQDPQIFKILAFGRGTLEDFQVKGYDIAAKAIGGMRQGKYSLIFVGAPEGKQEEIKNNFLKQGIKESQLRVRSLPESREELPKMFSEVDLCIMPSRSEGFGFTALEALSAGVPILVNENSGFGKALRNVPHGTNFVVDSDKPEDWKQRIEDILEKDRSVRLQEVDDLRRSYGNTYKWQEQCDEVVNKICNLPIPSGHDGKPQNINNGRSGQHTKPTRKRRGSQETKDPVANKKRPGVNGSDSTDGAVPLTNEELVDLSREITICWKSFGIILGEPPNTLDGILSNNFQFPAPEDKALQMLTNWIENGGTRAQLVTALKKERKGRLAERFEKRADN